MCEVFERRFSLQIPLIVTQLNLTIDQLRIIRRKRKHAFLYHCLLLCDCSRALIRAQEYISLVFPKRTKCAGSVQFGEKCAGSVFFSTKMWGALSGASACRTEIENVTRRFKKTAFRVCESASVAREMRQYCRER